MSVTTFQKNLRASSSPTLMNKDRVNTVEQPVDGVLDLHTFRPSEVVPLLKDYIALCHEKKIFSLRIIHGKGTGTLRETVHAQLKKNPLVKTFSLAEHGNWGATVVALVETT